MSRTGPSVLLLALVAVVLAGCPQPDPAPDAPPPDAPPTTTPAPSAAQLPEGVTADMVLQGQVIFQGAGICYSCHGMDGVGTPLGPDLTDGEWLNTDGSFASIEQVIRTGVDPPRQYPAPMPPMGGARLTDDQVRQLAAYVYSLGHGG